MSKVIITGASAGIGRELAIKFASLGWDVLAVARREKELEELKTIDPEHIRCIVADITLSAGREKILAALSATDCGVYLIHNAGIAQPNLLEHFDLKNWEDHFAINVTAPVALTSMLFEHLKHGGRVINISTSLAHKPGIALSAYAASKSALLQMKEQWNLEFGKYDICFASMQPGVVDTNIQSNFRALDTATFPSVELFRRFSEKKQLLSCETSAKFIIWLLTKTQRDDFIIGDWDIYDTKHHKYWATPGEVVQRDPRPEELSPSKAVIACTSTYFASGAQGAISTHSVDATLNTIASFPSEHRVHLLARL